MHKSIVYGFCLAVSCALLPAIADAQQTQTFVINGNSAGGATLQISNDQKIMFDAMNAVMKRDFKTAESLYTQAIAINGKNANAYVQRGIVRRELGDAAGTASDGRTAVVLANNALQGNPNDPNLYYTRGMGFRLTKNYDQAEKDIRTAIAQGGPSSWNTDIQAIELEKKAGD